MKAQKLLKAITTPVTKREIAEQTGMTKEQIMQGFRYISRKGGTYQTLGTGPNRHYYMSRDEQVNSGLGEKFIYEKIIDLIDTDEWWTMPEICDVLDLEPKDVGNKIRYINRRGHARIVHRRGKGNHTEYMVIYENDETTDA